MKRAIPLLLLFSLLLTSCSLNKSNSFSCELFYLSNKKSPSIVEKKTTFNCNTLEEAVTQAFNHLSDSALTDYDVLLPGGIELKAVSISNKTCSLTLSEEYLKLSDYANSLTDMCITKTMCSFADIDKVKIICGDKIFEFEESDFLLSAPRTYYDSFTANLYFTGPKSTVLIPESRKVIISPETSLENNVLSALLSGPVSRELKSPIPAGTSLNGVSADNGICVVDLSDEFINNLSHTQIDECLAIYSIVNTLTELPNIENVLFLVNGLPCDEFLYFDLRQPFTNTTRKILE